MKDDKDWELPEDQKSLWSALFRGAILTTQQTKHVQYMSMADQRAQNLIMINTLMIPLIVTQVNVPFYRYAVIIFLLTAVSSIFCAIMCLIPKRYGRGSEKKLDLFHFSGIWQYTEEEYMNKMRTLLNENKQLAEYTCFDLYHISRNIMKPKFMWLKLSYICFLTGLTLSVIVLFAALILNIPTEAPTQTATFEPTVEWELSPAERERLGSGFSPSSDGLR